MIKEVNVIISFPQGANFIDGINENIYRRFIHFIKETSCFCIDCRCFECEEKELCKYYQISGRNFNEFPGVIIKNDIFEKRKYQCNEQKKFTFYFIGEMGKYSGYITVFFEQMSQMLNGNLFYLKEIKTVVLEEKMIDCNELWIKTPMPSDDFIQEYNWQVRYYNKIFRTNFCEIDGKATMWQKREMKLNTFKVKTKTILMKGYIGRIHFDQKMKLDLRLLEIGIGRYNFIGGGQVEIEN